MIQLNGQMPVIDRSDACKLTDLNTMVKRLYNEIEDMTRRHDTGAYVGD